MRLTHLADYAVVLMTAAARREQPFEGKGGARLSAPDPRKDTGCPLPTAQKRMQQLAAHGLLVGHRGAGGGYALARPVAEISLADIVEAVEGPIVMTMCADGVNHECLLGAHCRVKPHMGIVGDPIRGALAPVVRCASPRPRARRVSQTRRKAAPSAPGWTPAFAGERP